MSVSNPFEPPAPDPRRVLTTIQGLSPPPSTFPLTFRGSGGTLFGIHVVNVLLTLLTLGVYYFWGKVRVRRYLLSQTEFQGDRFAFHGTGKELLLGWLRAALVFGLPILLLAALPPLLGAGSGTQALAGLLVYLLVQVFVPVAMVGARRYRLSRTSWRGIRFSFRGRAAEFLRIFLLGAFLSAITLGLYYPFFEARRHLFMSGYSYFGNRRFGFDGRGQDLLGLYLVGLVVAALSLGPVAALAPLWLPLVARHPAWAFVPLGVLLALLAVLWAWFSAKKQRYVWDHTSFGAARFRARITAGPLLRLRLVNLLLLVLSLGLAWPWTTVRTARFTCRYLTLEGALDLTAIQQEAQEATATGEGLAGFLDVGFDLG
jgi:uncharacterized membrane protein YjgN (DUF898 family)